MTHELFINNISSARSGIVDCRGRMSIHRQQTEFSKVDKIKIHEKFVFNSWAFVFKKEHSVFKVTEFAANVGLFPTAQVGEL